jgi:hypothetical protein
LYQTRHYSYIRRYSCINRTIYLYQTGHYTLVSDRTLHLYQTGHYTCIRPDTIHLYQTGHYTLVLDWTLYTCIRPDTAFVSNWTLNLYQTGHYTCIKLDAELVSDRTLNRYLYQTGHYTCIRPDTTLVSDRRFTCITCIRPDAIHVFVSDWTLYLYQTRRFFLYETRRFTFIRPDALRMSDQRLYEHLPCNWVHVTHRLSTRQSHTAYISLGKTSTSQTSLLKKSHREKERKKRHI